VREQGANGTDSSADANGSRAGILTHRNGEPTPSDESGQGKRGESLNVSRSDLAALTRSVVSTPTATNTAPASRYLRAKLWSVHRTPAAFPAPRTVLMPATMAFVTCSWPRTSEQAHGCGKVRWAEEHPVYARRVGNGGEALQAHGRFHRSDDRDSRASGACRCRHALSARGHSRRRQRPGPCLALESDRRYLSKCTDQLWVLVQPTRFGRQDRGIV